MDPFKLSRREFLKTTLITIWTGFLTACGIKTGSIANPTSTQMAYSNIESTRTDTPLKIDQTTETLTQTSSTTATSTSTSSSTPSPTQTEKPIFKLLNPTNGAELPTIGRITFQWDPHPNATSYRLEITLPNGKIETTETASTSYDRYLASLPLGGAYTWQVFAIDQNGLLIHSSDSFTFTKLAFAPTSTSTSNDSGNNGSGSTGSSGQDATPKPTESNGGPGSGSGPATPGGE